MSRVFAKEIGENRILLLPKIRNKASEEKRTGRLGLVPSTARTIKG